MLDRRLTRGALFRELHASIEETAAAAAGILGDASSNLDLSYPPGAALSASEVDALRSLEVSPAAREAIRKLIADACSRPVFEFLSLLDGVADPIDLEGATWVGLSLETRRESDEIMLHDEFFETYGSYAGE